jgi:hypothetical protein
MLGVCYQDTLRWPLGWALANDDGHDKGMLSRLQANTFNLDASSTLSPGAPGEICSELKLTIIL